MRTRFAALTCAIAASGLVTFYSPAPADASKPNQAQVGCLASGTDSAINAAFAAGGAGAEIALCPEAVFQLAHPVRFTHDGQRLFTLGRPIGASRATLRIAHAALTTAIDGDSRSNVTVEYLKVDGNRAGLGYLFGEGLVELGKGGLGQTVQHVAAYDTRSWTLLHVEEGLVVDDVPQCQGARILNNTFGPAGSPTGTWSDGVSLACGNSLVEGNTITDVTDSAIVVFGAPGSVIRNNRIVADTQTLLGGINLVDYRPTNGNYTATTVTGNTIDGRNAFIKVGIAMGPQVWSCVSGVNYGATVTNNTVTGLHVGYGYAVNGVRDWTVTGNVDTARHVGVPGSGCIGSSAGPDRFQFDVALSSSLQPEFRGAALTDVLGVVEPGVLTGIRPPTRCGRLTSGEGLNPGQYLTSCDTRFKLILQGDGNLVLYQRGVPLWSTRTHGRNTAAAVFTTDGTLNLYGPAGELIWVNATTSHPGAVLRLQNDGNMVIYDAAKVPVWSTDTRGTPYSAVRRPA